MVINMRVLRGWWDVSVRIWTDCVSWRFILFLEVYTCLALLATPVMQSIVLKCEKRAADLSEIFDLHWWKDQFYADRVMSGHRNGPDLCVYTMNAHLAAAWSDFGIVIDRWHAPHAKAAALALCLWAQLPAHVRYSRQPFFSSRRAAVAVSR